MFQSLIKINNNFTPVCYNMELDFVVITSPWLLQAKCIQQPLSLITAMDQQMSNPLNKHDVNKRARITNKMRRNESTSQ